VCKTTWWSGVKNGRFPQPIALKVIKPGMDTKQVIARFETPSARLRQSTTSADIASQRQSDPRRLPKLLHGELDWITMKTLEKDRTHRYETVNGLARDLQSLS
jgi:hypothetical protein